MDTVRESAIPHPAARIGRSVHGIETDHPERKRPRANMPEVPSEDLSVTEHVREAWRLLLQLPDGERERVTEDLAGRYAWSEVEAGASVMRRALNVHGDAAVRVDDLKSSTDPESTEDELAEITVSLTPADVAKVRSLVGALRDGMVTVAELDELPEREWMDLIAARRAA